MSTSQPRGSPGRTQQKRWSAFLAPTCTRGERWVPLPPALGFGGFKESCCRRGLLRPPREHLSNPAAGVTGARASPRDAASPRALFEVSPQNPALLSQLLGGLQGVSGAFHHTSQERVGGTQGEPGPVPYRRRRSARSGRSNLCWGAPSSWTWSRRCERQSGGAVSTPGGLGKALW